jgi:cell wall-associated NlpC family hydrolase
MPRLLVLLACLLSLLAAAPAGAAAQGWEEEPYVEEEQYAEDDPYVEEDPYAEEPEYAVEDEYAPEHAEPEATPAPEPVEPEIPLVTAATVSGRQAMLRTNGKAAIPRGAPARVRAIIAAANEIVGKRYKWGGGHAKLFDRGYDCSGTVGYALIRAGLLASPMVSGTFARWGAKGAGRWMTIYANKGHVYMEVAGLRLDTSAVGDQRGGKGPRWRPVIGKRRGFKVRHIAGL